MKTYWHIGKKGFHSGSVNKTNIANICSLTPARATPRMIQRKEDDKHGETEDEIEKAIKKASRRGAVIYIKVTPRAARGARIEPERSKGMPKKKTTVREKNQKLKETKAYLGKDMNGERLQKSFYGKTLTEARAKANEYKEQLKRSEIVDKNVVFTDWAEKWIKTCKENNIKSSTYSIKYKSFLDSHLKPYFKQAKIANIGQIDIQGFINSKSKFTKETQRRYISILKAMFEGAVENNIIYRNPVKKIVIKSENKKTIKRTYNQEEVDRIVEFAKTHKHGASIIVLLKTGLRRGELLALKWSDIDFKSNVINLQRSVADIPYNGKLAPVVMESNNDKKTITEKSRLKKQSAKRCLALKKQVNIYFRTLKATSTARTITAICNIVISWKICMENIRT